MNHEPHQLYVYPGNYTLHITLWLASKLQNVCGMDAGHTEAYALDKLTHQPNSFENQDDVEGFREY